MPVAIAISTPTEALVRIEALRRADEALRSLPRRNQLDPEIVAWALGMIRAATYPSRINANGQTVYYDAQSDRYLVRNTRGGTGYWVEFDAQGRVIGTTNEGLIPVERHAQPPADELEKIWQNPPHVPPRMPPPILPGRPIDPPRKPDVEGYPGLEPRKPEIIPGPRIIESKPDIESIPRPEIELPPIYQSDDDSGREEMVPKPGQSGKEAANDVPDFARGRSRFVGETPNEYADRIMKEGYGDDWRKTQKTGPKSNYNKIKKYGSRHWMPKPKP